MMVGGPDLDPANEAVMRTWKPPRRRIETSAMPISCPGGGRRKAPGIAGGPLRSRPPSLSPRSFSSRRSPHTASAMGGSGPRPA